MTDCYFDLCDDYNIFSTGNTLFTYENHWIPTEDNPKDEASAFICHAFSKDQEYLAALTEDKKLLVWKDNTLDCS